MKKTFSITKVLSRNIFIDAGSKLQNAIGMNLTWYEQMVERGMGQIRSELKRKKITPIWHRYEITELDMGAVMIVMYGETE